MSALGCSRVLLVSFIPVLHDATYLYCYWGFQQDVNPDLEEVSVPCKQHT